MGASKDRLRTPYPSRDTLDVLVSKICEQTQLMESTVRDLFSHGWTWQEDRWVKQNVFADTPY